MSAALPDAFWPPADELTEAAERIRATLGVWPQPAARSRICLAPPEHPRAGDLWVATAGDADADAAHLARLTTAGAQAIVIDDTLATLYAGAARHALAARAPLAEDWIAALAAFLDCGFPAPDALVLALAWRDGDEARGDDSWPVDPARFPRALDVAASPESAFPACPHRLGLYPVLPSAEWVERVLDCGVKTVQLRVKDASPDALRAQIGRAVAAGRRHPDARVFINDHWRLALDAGAYGIHLGQEDLETADLAAIAQAGVRLGLSSHGYYEMLVALQVKPSYLALGPVFATTTKAVAAPPQGLARLARYARFAGPQAPLVAIGGITVDTLGAVLAAGVGSAAVVSAVTAAADYRAAIIAMQQIFGR